MNNEELKEILENHAKYLNGDSDLKRANLRGAVLCDADLRDADLRDADLRDADLRDANLFDADFHGAYLLNANLSDANLSDANLFDADLHGAYLLNANLHGADLYCANLCGADLHGANIDFSCLPLCCGSLHVHFDNRQMIQILYHLLSVVSYSKYASEEMKKALLTPELCDIANKFHRVNECGKILPMDFTE